MKYALLSALAVSFFISIDIPAIAAEPINYGLIRQQGRVAAAQAEAIRAGDVHVNGYYRRDGTYVRPHVRSSPDGIRSNNYGRSEYYGQPPAQRDHDRDGIANMYDRDDDNDGIGDNSDRSQYGGGR